MASCRSPYRDVTRLARRVLLPGAYAPCYRQHRQTPAIIASLAVLPHSLQYDNKTGATVMMLLSWQSHHESSRSSFDEHRLNANCKVVDNPQTKHPAWGRGTPFPPPLSIHFLIFCSLLPFPFFLFSSTLLIFFYCLSDPFLPE